jgi:hypothetical protein
LFLTNGSRYEGEFKNDQIEGKGVYFFNNSERYEGHFKENNLSGNGTYFFNNGDKTEGKFSKFGAFDVHTRKLANGQVQKITY